MALETNQRGYDVISADNERISVKTVTTSTHVAFNQNTMHFVDRVIVLRVNVDDENGVSVETLQDSSIDEFVPLCRPSAGKVLFDTYTRTGRQARPLDDLRVTEEATFEGYLLRKYENGTIVVLADGQPLPTAKPTLREIAALVGVDILNGSSLPKNTRQLGADVIRTLNALPTNSVESMEVAEEAVFQDYVLRKYASGTIAVLLDGQPLSTAKPTLREIASLIGVDTLSSNSVIKNTRQLGSDVIRALNATPARER